MDGRPGRGVGPVGRLGRSARGGPQHRRPVAGFAIGAGLALLTVLALRSVSIRLASSVVVLVGAAFVLRFGTLSVGGGSLSSPLVGWLAGTVATVVVGHRISSAMRRPLPGGPDGLRAGEVARAAVLVSLVVATLVVVIGPLAINRLASATVPGEAPSSGAAADRGSALRSARSLDTTVRPSLGDDVVFTVQANRPAFWRGEMYDQWDGRTWYRTDQGVALLSGGTDVIPDPLDDGARGSDHPGAAVPDRGRLRRRGVRRRRARYGCGRPPRLPNDRKAPCSLRCRRWVGAPPTPW